MPNQNRRSAMGDETGPNAVWSDEFDPAWAAEVANWEWVEWQEGSGPREGVKKSGKCPRCTHRIILYAPDVRFVDRP